MMIIKQKDLILRHVKVSDAQTLFEIEIDKENIKNMMWYHDTIEGVKKAIKEQQAQYRKKKPSGEQIIIETEDGVAGYVSIHGLNREHIEHKAEISYALHPDFRGKGITAKAVTILTKYACKKYNLKRIEASCRSFNTPSIKVLEQAEYTFEGVHKKDVKKNGKYLDNMYFAYVK